MKSQQDKTPDNNFDQWVEDLENGKRTDPELEIASRVKESSLPVPVMSQQFDMQLRLKLLEQADNSTKHSKDGNLLNWITSAAGIVALIAVLFLSQRLLPQRGGFEPGSSKSAALESTQSIIPTASITTDSTLEPSMENIQETQDLPTEEAMIPLNDEIWEFVFAADPTGGITDLPANARRDHSLYLDDPTSLRRLYLATKDGDRIAYLAGGPYVRTTLLGFSPDGQKALVYSFDDVFYPPDQENGPAVLHPKNFLLYVANLDGSAPVKLSDRFKGRAQQPYKAALWLPDSDRIVMIDEDGDGPGVFSIRSNGLEKTRLSPPGIEPIWLLPAATLDRVYWQEGKWTPVEEILVKGPVSELGTFWSSELDGSGSEKAWQALSSKLVNISPQTVVAISPNGERLAVVDQQCWQQGKEVDVCRKVQVANQGGEWQTDLEFPGKITNLIWSPDGSMLLVETRMTRGEDIGKVFYLWRDGGEAAKLPDELERWIKGGWQMEQEPAWSPDGKYILFKGDMQETPRIINVETFGVEPIFLLLDFKNARGEIFSLLQWVP